VVNGEKKEKNEEVGEVGADERKGKKIKRSLGKMGRNN
jgi:hypothetical protein